MRLIAAVGYSAVLFRRMALKRAKLSDPAHEERGCSHSVMVWFTLQRLLRHQLCFVSLVSKLPRHSNSPTVH